MAEKTAKFDPTDPGNHIPIRDMTKEEREAWTADYIKWIEEVENPRQRKQLNAQIDAINRHQQELKDYAARMDATLPRAGEDSPFYDYSGGWDAAPSVADYGNPAGNAPPHWINLYGAIQSGRAKIKDVEANDPETGAPYTYKALVDKNGNPLPGSLAQLAPNVYALRTGSGQYTAQFSFATDPKSGYVSPITDMSKQYQSWRHAFSGGGIGGYIEDIFKGVAGALNDLGPLGKVAMAYAVAQTGGALAAELGISQAAGIALANGGLQLAYGASIEDAVKAAGTSLVTAGVANTVGSAVNQLTDQVGAATSYGTDVGSVQNAVLAAQDAGMGTVADLTGDVLGRTAGAVAGAEAKGVLTGRDVNIDPLMILQTAGAATAVPAITGQIEGFGQLPAAVKNAINATLTAELSNKDPTQALINQALQLGRDAVRTATKDYESRPADDGTTVGIQDVINNIPTDQADATTVADLVDDVTTPVEGVDTVTGGQDTAAGGQDIFEGNDPFNALFTPQEFSFSPDQLFGPPQDFDTTLADVINPWEVGPVRPGESLDTGMTQEELIRLMGPEPQDALDGGADTLTGGEEAAVDDGTTEGIQEVIDTLPRVDSEGRPIAYATESPLRRGSDGSYMVGNDWGNRFFDDESSPTGYRSVNGDVVNEDGSVWVDPNAGQDTLAGGEGNAVDDGTTGGIQDVIDRDMVAGGTETEVDKTCAEGFHWDETLQMCIADSDEPAKSTDCADGYVYNVVTQECEKITDTGTGSTGSTGGKPATGGTGGTGGKPATGGTGGTGGTKVTNPLPDFDLANLLSLMGGSAAVAQQPQGVPVVGESAGFDFSSPLDVSLFGTASKKKADQNKPGVTKISYGGYLDDLLDSIK